MSMKFAPLIDPAVRKPAPKPVAGVIIGLLLLIWEYFDRWDYRRLGQ